MSPYGAAPSPFGGTSPSLFGATAPAAVSTGTTPSFGSLFGAPAQSAGAFSFPSFAPAQAPGMSVAVQAPGKLHCLLYTLLKNPIQEYMRNIHCGLEVSYVAPMCGTGVATSPYGSLPEAPRVAQTAVEHKVGISQRPQGLLSAGAAMRPFALLSPRSIMPRSGVRMRSTRSRSTARCAIVSIIIVSTAISKISKSTCTIFGP